MARATWGEHNGPPAQRAAPSGVDAARPRTTLIIFAVLALQCLAYVIRAIGQLNRPSVGGAGFVLAILLCQFALYAILGVGLWHGRRWAVVATAVVLTGEIAWAVLVAVSNDLYTPQFMTLAALSGIALVALVPAGARSFRGQASAV
jgi:hypothetical protein